MISRLMHLMLRDTLTFLLNIALVLLMKIHGCEMEDISTGISIEYKTLINDSISMTEGEGNGDESDKYLEAQDRRYSGF